MFVKLSEVEHIEFLPHDGYRYGSLNHVKADGTRRNWQQEFYHLLENCRTD